MSEEKIWTDKFHRGSDLCSTAAARILVLARAFKITGNLEMYHELTDICEHLLEAEELISNAVGEKINEDVKNAEESTRNMFEGIFAGMKLLK